MARLILPALGTSFALTLGGSGDKLVFEPQAGATLTKTFTTQHEFALDDLSVIVNGQDVADMMGKPEVGIEIGGHIEVTDTYKSVKDGRPLELARTFDALTGKAHFEVSLAHEEVPEVSSSSLLEGKTVVFRWNEMEQAYDRSFQGDEDDEDLLKGLDEDMDLRVLLPSKEVAVNDSWTIELSELHSLAMPGGNLHMRPENAEENEEAERMLEEFLADFQEDYGELIEGDCTCTYKGTRKEGEANVAEIALELEVSASLDLSEFLNELIRAAIDKSGMGDAVQVSLETADLNVDFDGSGTLLWDLGAGRLHSFQLGADGTIAMDSSIGVEAEGESQDMDASLELSGSVHQEVKTAE